MNIVRDFVFNAPVDNENVVSAKPFIGAREYYKMFQIIPNVWIVPHRYYREIDKINEDNQDKTLRGSIYDKKYLSEDPEKDQFLQNMITLFKRIEKCEGGRNFLIKLSNSIAFPEKNSQGKYIPRTLIQTNQGEYKMKNVLIFGPGFDLTDNAYFSCAPQNISSESNGKGASGEIRFNPNFGKGYDEFLQDPALSLFHELTHALYGLYGISTHEEIPLKRGWFTDTTNKIIGADSQQSLEETLVFGGEDAKNIKLGNVKYKDFEQKCIQNYKIACDELLQASEQNFANVEIFENLKQKYINDKAAEKVKELLEISETSFAKQLTNSKGLKGISCRKHYSVSDIQEYRLNLEHNYTPELGFIRGQNKKIYKQDFVTAVQRKPLISLRLKFKKADELITVPVNAPIFKEDCIKIVPNHYFQDMDLSTESQSNMDISESVSAINENIEFFKNEDLKHTILLPKNIGTDDQITTFRQIPISISNDSIDTLNIDVVQPTSYHYLVAQEFNPDIDTKNVKIVLSNSFAETIGNTGKVYSYFPKVIHSVNLDPDFTQISNVQLNFQTWLQTVINDFTVDAEKKELNDKITDLGSIVPWIGPALNLANEAIYHHDLISALKVAGIMALLEIAPEFAFPIAIYAKITDDLSQMEEDKIDNFVNTALVNRKKLWVKMYNLAIYQWWENYYLQFAHRLNQVKKSLENQIKAIKAIIEYQFNQIQDKLNAKQKQGLLMVIDGAEERLYKSAQVALRNVGDFFQANQANYFENTILPQVNAKMAKIDIEIFNDLNNKLGINKDKYYKKLNDRLIINQKPKFVWENFPNIKELMDELSFINQKDAILSLKINQSKIIDVTGSFESINPSGNIITNGRGEKAFKLQSNTSDCIEIVNNYSPINFGTFQDFTVSFWIRVPCLSKIPKESATIITNSKLPEELGWSLVLQNQSLIWKITDGEHAEELIEPNLRDNRWHHIVISHNRLDKMYMYVDGKKKYSKVINKVANLNTNENIIMKYNSKESGFFIKLQDFNIFSKCFYEDDVNGLYNEYFIGGIIRDWWGEEVKYNTNYYLQNKAFPGQGINLKSSYGIPYVKLNTSNGKRDSLYNGLKIKLEPLGDAEWSVEYRNINKIKLADESSTLKYFTIESTDSSKRWIRLNDNDWASHCTFLPGTNISMNSPYFKIKLPADKKSGIMKQADKKEFWLWSNTSSEYLTKYPLYIYDDIHWRLIPQDEGWYE